MIGKRYFFVLFFIFSFSVKSQTRVLLSTNQKNIIPGDIISVQLIIEGETDAELLSIENIDLFNVEGQGTSTSFKYINGQSSKEKTINYELSLKKSEKNKVYLGPAVVDVNGKKVKSNYLVFSVKNKASSSGQKNNKPAKDLYFLDVSLKKESLYVNQKTALTLKFYNSVDFTEANLVTPESKDYWLEQNGKQKNSREVINGKAYKVTTISYFFTPLKKGIINLDGFAINGLAILPDNSASSQRQRQRLGFGFDSFFNDSMFKTAGKRRRVNLKAPSIKISVEELPGTDSGVVFDGVVGNFKIRESDYSKSIKSDDSLMFSFTVSGDGNLNLLEFQKEGEDFKVFKDKDESIPIAGGDLFQTRRLTYLLIPQKTGVLKIPIFSSKYFDPVDKVFKELNAGGGEIRVNGKIIQSSTKSPAKNDLPKNNVVKELNKIKENPASLSSTSGVYEIPHDGALHSLASKILRSTNFVMTISLILSSLILLIILVSELINKSLGNIFKRKNDTKNEIEKIFSLIKQESLITSSNLDEVLKLAMGENYSVIRNENFSVMKSKGMADSDVNLIEDHYLKFEASQFSQISSSSLTKTNLKEFKNVIFKLAKKMEVLS